MGGICFSGRLAIPGTLVAYTGYCQIGAITSRAGSRRQVYKGSAKSHGWNESGHDRLVLRWVGFSLRLILL